MSKAIPSFSGISSGKKLLFLTATIMLLGLSTIAFSVYSQENSPTVKTASRTSELAPTSKQAKTNCCGEQIDGIVESYTLLGSYYSLNDGQETTLMFNNKGPQPLVVSPTFHSLSGERLDLQPLTIPATSYQEFDLRVLLANNLPQFAEGSLQITHQGMKLQLGVQIKILKPGLIFDEQLVQVSKFVSSRLESVWWMPSSESKTKFILSNTTDAAVTATVKVDGTAPKQNQPTTIQLNPHQTRVLDIMRDLVGRANGGTIHKEGGISVTHSGTPGAVLARMLISRESTGFSTAVNFIDPEATVSSKWHGSGYRLGAVGSENLTPIVVARNVGAEAADVGGRLSYTNDAGEVVFVNVPSVRIAAGSVKTIDVERAVRQSNVPANVTDTGFEFEYSTPHGSVVMTALSVSASGEQVFQVPLYDPEKMPSSAGGYPWRADGDYVTKLYIKNETEHPQKYIAQLIYEGGGYALGTKNIKPHQSVTIDFKELRDNQTPDAGGRVIPLTLERGQIGWSSRGKTNFTLSGRSHQSSLSQGISSTYDCRNCCPNTIHTDGAVLPFTVETDIDSQEFFGFQVTSTDCYGLPGPSYIDSGFGWSSSNYTIASITDDGMATANDAGEASMFGYFENVSWQNKYECYPIEEVVSGEGEMAVRPSITSISPSRGGVGSTTGITINGRGFRAGATVSAGTGITVSNVTVISSVKITADFAIAANATGGNRSVTVTVAGKTSNSINFFVQIPTSLSVLSVTVISTPTVADPLSSSCSPGADYGISVAIKFQVNDQSNPSSPIKNNIMVPQETVTNLVVNGGQPSNPFPTYDDLGPSNVTGTSRTTDTNGQFIDAPLGFCANAAFTSSFVQNIRILIDNTQNSYHVRTNNFAFASAASGQGSVTNNSDIQKSRP